MLRFFLLLTMALSLSGPAAARVSQRKDAKQSFARGTRLFERGEYVTAIAAFERAYELKPHYAVQCSIALCHQRLNRFVEAAAHFRRCLKEGASRRRAKAAEVRRSLARVQARISWVEVKSPGKGGTVHVDGEARGPAPQRMPLNPGRHVLEVRREGATPARLALKVLGGEERSITLVPEDVEVSQPAVVEPVRPEPIKPEPQPVPVKPRERRGLSQGWFWTTVALTVALSGAAAAMGALTYTAHGDYNEAPTKEGYDTFVQRRLITNILAGAAVAAGVTGTVLFFYTDFGGPAREEDDEAGLATRVVVGIRGTF
jgi:tetratricopeptide (TPR) repeat protein